MSEKYDEVPREWWGNPKRIWQAQIKGEKNFDSYSFMGCLNDLQSDPDWREAFAGIETTAGMAEFMDRLQNHFNLCKSPQNTDGSTNVYQHPSRTKSEEKLDKDFMLELAHRNIQTHVKAFKLSELEECAETLSKISIVWSDDNSDYYNKDFRIQGEMRDGRPAGLYLSEAWDFEFYMKRSNDEVYCLGIDGVSKILGDLEEAVYSLANDFGLRRHLMQSFFEPSKFGLDVSAEYELEWVNNCLYYFDETTCYVTKAPK